MTKFSRDTKFRHWRKALSIRPTLSRDPLRNPGQPPAGALSTETESTGSIGTRRPSVRRRRTLVERGMTAESLHSMSKYGMERHFKAVKCRPREWAGRSFRGLVADAVCEITPGSALGGPVRRLSPLKPCPCARPPHDPMRNPGRVPSLVSGGKKKGSGVTMRLALLQAGFLCLFRHCPDAPGRKPQTRYLDSVITAPCPNSIRAAGSPPGAREKRIGARHLPATIRPHDSSAVKSVLEES